ncbi:MAG: hypothetical protein FWC42_07845 [Proteobacteria bacterium]|nr:hypothetical protein [Pseudomonadota bacterium]
MRIETIDDLILKLNAVFDGFGPLEHMSNDTGYSVLFAIPGKKAKLLMENLNAKKRTDPALWNGAAGMFLYTNEQENWNLSMKSGAHMIECVATVTSLHKKWFEENNLPWPFA